MEQREDHVYIGNRRILECIINRNMINKKQTWPKISNYKKQCDMTWHCSKRHCRRTKICNGQTQLSFSLLCNESETSSWLNNESALSTICMVLSTLKAIPRYNASTYTYQPLLRKLPWGFKSYQTKMFDDVQIILPYRLNS